MNKILNIVSSLENAGHFQQFAVIEVWRLPSTGHQ